MSKDILLATSFSAFGAGIYGLYYAWKLQQTQDVLKKETEVEPAEDEKTCIKMMLNSEMVGLWLDQLVKLMKADYGYDITNDVLGGSVQDSLFKDYPILMEYFNLITTIKEFYKKYAPQIGSMPSIKTPLAYSANNQEFIRKWLEIFNIRPVNSDLKYNTDKGELDTLTRGALATMNFRINNFLDSDEWKEKASKNYGDLLQLLKDKKCIDLGVGEEEFKNTVWISMLEEV